AGEWLLDNYYVIQQALRMVKDDMPRGYYDKLPALTTTEMAGYPRIYALACYILDASTAALSVADIISLCQRYQQTTPLEIGELWALPTMLRAHLIENILEALRSIAKLEDVLPVRMPFRRRAGDDPTDIVANSIMSLRALAYQDWNEFFEAVSLVESALRMDPAGIYTRMDEPTRNRYREAVERIAERTGCGEETIAQAAVACARESAAQSKSSASLPFQPVGPGYREYAAHVGYYLVDEGRAALERSVGHQPSWVQHAKHQAATNRTLLYLGSVLALTAILLLIVVRLAFGYLGSPLQLIVTLLLALFPVSTTAIQIVDWCVMRWIPPRLLPRLDFHDGIPEQFRTFVVMPVLISTTEDIDALFDHLEMHYLRNKDDCLHFALLADFPDAPEAHQPDDDALIHYAGQCVEALTARAGNHSRFFFFLRKRRWNPGEQTWMGWERKRGKLAMFNQLLLKPDAPTDYTVQFGDLSILPTIRYVITLDADTILPRDQAQSLIGTLAHPLNRAVYSTHERALARGYSILQPRVEILQLATQQSPFTRLFVGATGLDLYTLAVSNLYQDLFGEAIYVGKGIYDVAAFEHGLEGCVPENALLSHDLYEGIHGRVGLVTDVAFIEDYPTHYLAHQLRIHRWIRGDWQLLPWLWRRAPAHRRPQDCSQFSVINTWKIIDNLRRSLVFPALLAFFICAWLGILPGSDQFAAALLWTALGLLFSFSPFVGALFSHIASLRSRPSQNTIRSSFSADMTRWALSIAFLAYEALLAVDAIVTTTYRLIRRRKLLQWTTAAHTNRLFGENAGEDSVIWQQMTPLSTMVVGLVVLMILTYPQHLAIAAPLLVAWALSPILIKYISRPIPEARPELLAGDRRELRRLARRTWLYFEEFVGPASHWLPPDHFQEKPHAKTVYSTSPTNIGLLMLSTLTAYDLGYIGANDVAVRLRLTIDTLDKLEHYRGHLLNWYDAQTLDPLPPRYVSTVDSGNLVGCLIALRQGFKELADRPVVDGRRWQGLLDLLAILDDLVQAIEPDEPVKLRSRRAALESAEGRPEQWPSLLAAFTAEDIPELGQTLVSFLETHRHNLEAAQISEVRLYLDRIRQHSINFQRDLDRFVPWLSILARPSSELGPVDSPAYTAYQDILTTLRTIPTFGEAEAVYQHVLDQITLARDTMRTQAGREMAIPWLDELTRRVEKAGATARELQNAYADLDRRALGWIESHDFCFLFDDERCIFHIGYDVSAERLDGSYYDLLASEARIASYVALAKGDVPQEHWLHLGRPMTTVQNTVALLSWSGTMFEYLMPALLMRDYPSTLLHESYRAVVDQQMAYAHERGVPWGISESGYHTLDSSSNYQYRAFGVPHLAFKRGLDTDLVIAPYASLLALPIRPDAVLKNIAHLKRFEALGAYGFYEAVDFTPRHLALGEAYAVVREYMAHHQGMILVAVNNMLNDDTMIRRFHADPRIQSIDLLLQEKIPTQPNLQYPEAERQETPVATTNPTAGPWTVPI
ncbi:MAG: cellobiose phosphorylase, partial [Anaerolineae bacterium]|nr:cellobiose phosphorylase [Anaerolineae bacterium]